MKNVSSICVYCGSSIGNNQLYSKVAKALGVALTKKKLSLVYGGGASGLMGEVARSVIENGGKVTGIIPGFLTEIEAKFEEASELIITENMHTRKELLFEKSDAFIALPGGIGTLEELLEVLTWAQLSLHIKPVILLNINDYWRGFINLLYHMDEEGFMTNKIKPNFKVVERVEDIFDAISQAQIDIENYENGISGID